MWSGFLALKCKLRGIEELGEMMPSSCGTLNSSPKSSAPCSLQDTGRAVLLCSITLRLSCLERKLEEGRLGGQRDRQFSSYKNSKITSVINVQYFNFIMFLLYLEGLHCAKIPCKGIDEKMCIPRFSTLYLVPVQQNPVKMQMLAFQLQHWPNTPAGEVYDDKLWIVLDIANNTVLHLSQFCWVGPHCQLLAGQRIFTCTNAIIICIASKDTKIFTILYVPFALVITSSVF